jgi:hypothetical protein
VPNKIVLPRNWDVIASLLEFMPNSVLAGSIVDHILLSDDPSPAVPSPSQGLSAPSPLIPHVLCSVRIESYKEEIVTVY